MFCYHYAMKAGIFRFSAHSVWVKGIVNAIC
jgi:hypothetical protein